MYFIGTFRFFLLYFSWTFIFFFFVSVELLEIQDQYAKDVIQYLQVLDPGRTWRKSQILSKLRAITTALAKVSCIIIFMTYFLLHIKNCKTNQWVSKKFLYRIYHRMISLKLFFSIYFFFILSYNDYSQSLNFAPKHFPRYFSGSLLQRQKWISIYCIRVCQKISVIKTNTFDDIKK